MPEEDMIAQDCEEIKSLIKEDEQIRTQNPIDFRSLSEGQVIGTLEKLTNASKDTEDKLKSETIKELYPSFSVSAVEPLVYYGTMALGELGWNDEAQEVLDYMEENYPTLETTSPEQYNTEVKEIREVCQLPSLEN